MDIFGRNSPGTDIPCRGNTEISPIHRAKSPEKSADAPTIEKNGWRWQNCGFCISTFIGAILNAISPQTNAACCLTHVLIRQVTPDPISASAFYALSQRLGESDLIALKRLDYWGFTWNLSPEESETKTAWLLKTSADFVHPSKHRWNIVPTGERIQLLSPPDEHQITGAILVTDSDSTQMESKRDGLINLYPECGSLESLEHATWWELSYPKTIDSESLRSHLEALALTRSRTEGFFAHPHYQKIEILVPG